MALHILLVFLTLATVECRVRNDTDGPCSMSPCLNGGICNESTSSSLGYVCLCPSWYRGSNCDVSSSCLSSPCQNGGTCKVSTFLNLGYWCTCTSGYSGNNCDIFSSCSSSPCQNGGTCEDLTFSNLGYRCTCPPGYTGSNCDIYDQCSSSPCQNGGVCDVTFSILGYTCTCPSGYSGINCNFINDNLNFLPNPAPSTSSRMTVIYILVPPAVLLKLVLFASCIYFRRRRILKLRLVTPSAKSDISNRTIPPLHEATPPYCPDADVEGAGGLGTMNPGYDVTSAAPQQSVSSGVEPDIVSVNERNCPPSFEETVKPQPWHNDRQPLIE